VEHTRKQSGTLKKKITHAHTHTHTHTHSGATYTRPEGNPRNQEMGEGRTTRKGVKQTVVGKVT